MNLSEILLVERIKINPVNRSKNDLIEELIDLAVKTEGIQNRDDFRKKVFEREALQSTGLADGIAIPHAKAPHVKKLMVCLGACQSGVDFDAVDEQPTYLVFLIAVPENQDAAYLRLLSQIARIFGKPHVREQVLKAKAPHEIIQTIRNEEGLLVFGA